MNSFLYNYTMIGRQKVKHWLIGETLDSDPQLQLKINHDFMDVKTIIAYDDVILMCLTSPALFIFVSSINNKKLLFTVKRTKENWPN